MENRGNRVISFSPTDMSEAEIVEVIEALRSSWITIGGREIITTEN